METTTPPWIAVIAPIAPSPSSATPSSLGMAAGAPAPPSGRVLDETTETTGTSPDERVALAPTATTTRENGLVKDVPTLDVYSEGSGLPEHLHGVLTPTHKPRDMPTPSTSAAPHENLFTPSLVAPRSTSTPEPPFTTHNISSSTSSTPPPVSALRSHPIRRSSPLKQELYEEGNIGETSFIIGEKISVEVAPITSTCAAAATAITPARVAKLREQVVSKDSAGCLESPCGETSADSSFLFFFNPLYTNHTITQSPNSNDDVSLIMNERGSFLLPSDDSLAPTPIKKQRRGELSEIMEGEEEAEKEEQSANLSQLLKGLREGSPLSINLGWELGRSTRTLSAQEVGERRTPSRLGAVEVLASTPPSSIMTSPTQVDKSMMDRSKIDDVEELFEKLAEHGKGSGSGGVEHDVQDESMLSLFGGRDESIEQGEEMVGSVAKEPAVIPLPQTRVQETPADHSIITLEDVHGACSQLLAVPSVSSPVEQDKRVEDESMLSFEAMRDETIGVIEGKFVDSSAMESPMGKVETAAFMASPLGTPEGMRTVRPLSPVARGSTPTTKTSAEVPWTTTMAKTVPTPSRGLERLRNKMVSLRLKALQTQNQAVIPLGHPIPSTATEPTPNAEPDVLPTPSTPVRRPRLSSTILQTPIGSSAAALRLEKYRAMNTPKTVWRDGVVATKLPSAEEGKGKNEAGTSAPRTPSTTTTTTPMRTVSTLDTSAKRHKRSETIQLTSSVGRSLFSPAVGSRAVAGLERGVGMSPLVRMAVGGDRRRSLTATSAAVASPVKMRSLREGAVDEARPVRSLIVSTATTGRIGANAGRIGSTTTTTATRPIPSVRSTAYSTTPSRVPLLTGGRPTPRVPTTTRTTLLPNWNDQNVAPARSRIRPSTTSTTSSNLLPLRSSALLKTRPTFQPRVLKPLVSTRRSSSTTSTSVDDRIATGNRPRLGLGPLPARSMTIGTVPAGVCGGSGVGAGVGARTTTAGTSTGTSRKSLAPVAGARGAVGPREVLR